MWFSCLAGALAPAEAVGGVVLMRFGENPRKVTEAIKEKIAKLQAGLPEGVAATEAANSAVSGANQIGRASCRERV